MNLPPMVLALGYAGLLPFFIGPAWLALAPASVPTWLDMAWMRYVAMIASFMAGTFWGFALPAAQGPAGQLGLAISIVLTLLAWVATLLPFGPSLALLAGVFLLLLVADFWRERVLDTLGGYFALRSALTVGVLLSIAWRFSISG
jgi:hypothetical protein